MPFYSQKQPNLMKKNLRFKPLLFHLMKISLIQCLVAVIFTGVSLAHDAQAQEATAEADYSENRKSGNPSGAFGH